jgi:hypothetical protein
MQLQKLIRSIPVVVQMLVKRDAMEVKKWQETHENEIFAVERDKHACMQCSVVTSDVFELT